MRKLYRESQEQIRTRHLAMVAAHPDWRHLRRRAATETAIILVLGLGLSLVHPLVSAAFLGIVVLVRLPIRRR